MDTTTCSSISDRVFLYVGPLTPSNSNQSSFCYDGISTDVGVWSLLEPAEAPAGVKTTVTNNTVTVKWSKAHNVRGLLQGYKVPLIANKQQTLPHSTAPKWLVLAHPESHVL